MSNIVAIVGRPNVGKSTLFNRLTGTKQAIVDEISGVTRDRMYGKSDWNGKYFSVIDTGGYINNSEDIFEGEIRKQVLLAIDEADCILFVVDMLSGLTDYDMTVANLLRKSGKSVFLVVNKVDTPSKVADANEFYSFGLGEIYCISSINGSGTGDLLDDVVAAFVKEEIPPEENTPRFAIVGRPNVGKSSLVNSLMNEERNIVTEIPGTTRDSIFTRYSKFGFDFYLIDTAGIRKKGKVHENIEFYSVLRAIRSIEYSDVCLLMIDATRGIEAQDLHIISIIQKNNKGLVILVNKWDLIDKNTSSAKKFENEIHERMAPFTDVPVIFTSATTKLRIHKVLETALEVYQRRIQKIPTSKLNLIIRGAVEANHPPAIKGKFIQIKYSTQLPTHAPSFAIFCNLPQYIKEPYRRYLENYLRKTFDFKGVPIQLFFRKK